MNEENKRMKVVMTVVVAGLLLLSVLTVAMVGVSAEDVETESSTVDEENTEMSEKNPELAEKIMERIQNIEGDRDPSDPAEKLDMLDPELTELLSGADVSEEGTSSSEGILTDPHTVDQHNVEAVHDMGITGENVTVSLMDTGFDMAQPDLVGQHAVFEYDEDTMPEEYEAYDGHPIAFDPVSMLDYAKDGNISQDYTVIDADETPGYDEDIMDNSWYVDTSYENTTYEEGGDIVADFSEKDSGVTYTMPDEVDEGEKVKFGLHPDDKLATWYGERPAVLLTQDDGGNWTNVYVDLENDRVFEEETGAWIDGDDPDSEAINKDIDGDGIADISGGMVYFVSDNKTPIPYSQHMRDRINTIINLFLGYPPGTVQALTGADAWTELVGSQFHTTPGDGDMVALMGDFNGFGSYGSHGTWTASAVVGQGVTGVPDGDIKDESGLGESPYPPSPEGGDGLTRGLAPNATIIPMGRFFDYLPSNHSLLGLPNAYTSLFFTTEGYTGDTEITSDSADIASSSFGSTVGANHGGFNFYERLFDYVGTQHSRNTLFVNSEGNAGSGFGTVSSPSGAKGVLSVGASSNQNYRVDGWNMYDGGPNPWAGEVTGMTSTGPHSMGSHGPDIMTNGQFGYGGSPLNQQLDEVGSFDGATSWTLWSGTSLSAPNAAGIAALVYQAYMEAHEEAPDSQTVKKLVMQGANDMKNSPHSQGPGDANALASVKLAQGKGLYSEESQWRPGKNPEMGQHVEHHVNMMEAGENTTDELTLHNWNVTEEQDIDYEMNAYKQEKVGETQIDLNSGTTGPHMDGRVPRVMINETGVYNLTYNDANDNWDVADTPMATLDNPNADLLRLGTHTPKENLGMYGYSFTEFYNWEDADGNGSFDGFDERNRIGYTMTSMGALGYDQTSDYMTIQDAMDRTEDGIVVQMNNVNGAYMEDFDFTLNIEQYNQVEWDWIEFENGTSGTLDAEETLEYNVTAEVPEDTIKGIYGGKLMIEDTTYGRAHQIPITITVGEKTDLSEPMEFGAAEGSDDHGVYRNDRLYGSWAGDLTGDWRFYTFQLEKQMTRKVEVKLEWANEDSNMSAYLLGGAERDVLGVAGELAAAGISGYDRDPFSVVDQLVDPSWNYQHRYGKNTLESMTLAGDKEYRGDDYVSIRTADELDSGTYVVAVQGHQISGDQTFQEFDGTVRKVPVTVSPDYGDMIKGDPVTVTAETHEPFGNLTSAQIELDGFYEDSQTVTEVREVSFDIPYVLSSTSHSYDITVTEESGMEYIWEDVTFDVDNIEPDLEITAPKDGVISLLEEREFTVEGVTDPDVARLQFQKSDITNSVGDSGEFTVEWKLPKDAKGYNEFTVVAEDEAGNTVEEEISVLYLPQIDDLQGQIYDLENETFALEQDIMSLEEDLDRLETRLQTQIDALKDAMEDVEKDVDDLQGQMREIKDNVKRLQGRVDLMESNLKDLESRVNTLERDLEDQIDELEKKHDEDLSNLRDDLESDIEDLEGKIDEHRQMLNDAKDRIDDAESDISSAESDIKDMEDEQETKNENQDDDISMARNLGIVGMILAILAIIIAVVAMQRKPTTEEGPTYEEEEEMPMEEGFGEEEPTEEEMFEEEPGEAEEPDEEMFEEEPGEPEEDLFEEEPEEAEEDLFEETEEEL